MRVVHLTDLHVQTVPKPTELLGKRLLGSANLFVLGRKRKFSVAAQQAAQRAALAARPDAVVVTGDLTAQGLPSEFEQARTLLEPLLRRVPVVLLPGNHDVYVRERRPAAAMRAALGTWMPDRLPYLRVVDEVAFVVIETCHPHLLSSGRTPAGQLEAAQALLDQAGDRFVFWCQHYPLRGRDGQSYGPSTRALSNAAEVEAFLARTSTVNAILHGHEHHGFRTTLPTAAGDVPILDPGASGYAWQPERDRTAHLNIYEVDRAGLHEVRRLTFDGEEFVPERGGAYATGR